MPNNFYMSLIRKEKGWSRKELAQKCGVSAETIKNIENGKSTPKLTTAFKIADKLETNVYLLFRKESYYE